MGNYFEEVVNPNDVVSKLAAQVCHDSRNNNAAIIAEGTDGGFRGPKGFTWNDQVLDNMKTNTVYQVMGNDSAGGKPQFYMLLDDPRYWQQLAWEWISMCADDIGRWGGLAVATTNTLDIRVVNETNLPKIKALFKGLSKALEAANLCNINGETAILKHQITSIFSHKPEDLVVNWGGCCIGLMPTQGRIDGSKIQPGQSIVALYSPGYRCNGGTKLTQLIIEKFGLAASEIRKNEEAMRFIRGIATPSISYAKFLSYLNGWDKYGVRRTPRAAVTGIAHLTGGGFNKFVELLPDGVGAELTTLPTASDVLLQAQAMSQTTDSPLSDEDCYTTFNGNVGMVMVCTNRSEASKTIEIAKQFGIDASVAGHTTDSDVVTLHSQFQHRSIVTLSKTD